MTRTGSRRQRGTVGARGTCKLRDYPVLLWLFLAAVVAIGHPYVAESRWLMVHLVLLGAITHSIMVWSTHFTQTLLKVGPRVDGRRWQSVRLWLLFSGTVAVLVGVPTGILAFTFLGAGLTAAAVIMHAIQLRRTQRIALPSRSGSASGTTWRLRSACRWVPGSVQSSPRRRRGTGTVDRCWPIPCSTFWAGWG